MGFAQGLGLAVGESFGLLCHLLRCRVLVCHAADTASLAAWFLFGKLFGVAMLVGFGEKRCRKNLPLGDTVVAVASTPCEDISWHKFFTSSTHTFQPSTLTAKNGQMAWDLSRLFRYYRDLPQTTGRS